MTFFGFVLGLFGLLTTTSGSEIQEPSVAVLAGTEFAHPDTLQGLDLNNYDHLLALAGSEGAFGAFYSKFGVPDCQQAPYFECKTSKSSAEGTKLLESAENKLRTASRMKERDERVWVLLALVENELKHPAEALAAIAHYLPAKTAVQVRTATELLLQTHLIATRNCFWADLSHIAELVSVLSNKSSSHSFPPLHYVELPGVSAKDVKHNCEITSGRLVEKIQGASQVKHARKIKLDKGKRINLGYINAVGFNEVYLFLALVFARNKTQFHVTCYAAQAATRQSGARLHMEQHCDVFVDVSSKTPAEVASRIAADKIHACFESGAVSRHAPSPSRRSHSAEPQDDHDTSAVLVDLNGYTQGADAPFLEALARVPAPVQLHFHGQPFTMGAPFIHGYVGDTTSTPVEYRDFYTERLVLLPEYYLMHSLPAIKSKAGSSSEPGEYSRAHFGFQESDLVLASFLQPYKIEPRVFNTWVRILASVPSAKLWLFRYRVQGIGGGGELEANILSALKAAGLNPNRVVLSDLFPSEHQHQIKRTADLFLDTFIFNAHTTAYDALFAGLPVLSLANETQPSRIASSLLKAAGLELCIARNEHDYEELAVRLLRTTRQKKRKKSSSKTERETSNHKRSEIVAVRELKERYTKQISQPVPVSLFDVRAFTFAFEAATRMAVEVRMRMHVVVSSLLRQQGLVRAGML